MSSWEFLSSRSNRKPLHSNQVNSFEQNTENFNIYFYVEKRNKTNGKCLKYHGEPASFRRRLLINLWARGKFRIYVYKFFCFETRRNVLIGMCF